jgi:xanthine dehydrogenase accessory factor
MSLESGVREKVLIKGAGEQASAAAHRLFRCGCRVVMTDLERPTAIRRTVSFCSAVYEREIEIEGVRGVLHRVEDVGALPGRAWGHIPVCVDPRARLVALWRPDVIVDARILKTNLDNQCSDAGLVIGLGPGLEAGRDVHYVVETMRGHHLGRIVERGFSQGDTGQPGEIGGYTHERLVRTPVGGVFESRRGIGDLVAAGDLVGCVAGAEVRAGIPGLLRGLAWPGLEVVAGQKIADVDPRGDPSLCRTLSDKARAISGSVLEIVVAHANRKTQNDP